MTCFARQCFDSTFSPVVNAELQSQNLERLCRFVRGRVLKHLILADYTRKRSGIYGAQNIALTSSTVKSDTGVPDYPWLLPISNGNSQTIKDTNSDEMRRGERLCKYHCWSLSCSRILNRHVGRVTWRPLPCHLYSVWLPWINCQQKQERLGKYEKWYS